MIFLFDRAKKLQKIIPRKHIINANPTVVRNGIYQLAVEVPLFYEDKKGTQYNYQKSVSKATFAGHYDVNGRFQLYKIYSRNITANEQGEFLIFDGVHIFFDEAKAMGNIHDRRFRDSEAKAPADAAFNSIGWTVIDYDVTDRHDINFYRASVTDAWNDLISTYGVEFDYELQFDGRKIISKNIIMKKQIGKWTGQRFAYGTNVLTLTQEQDESEVYTAAVGRGRGEETGDGFGPRLEFGDIAWSKDGITKPVGQNYIELPSATAEYGFIENGVVKPRIAPEIVFENIEDKKKLADSTYYWLLENCVPKATWKTEVARIGNLELGDTVGVLYKAAGIIKRARVEKIEYNLLDPELSKLTLGDFHHFENRQMKRINAQIKRLGRDSNDRITRIKNEWNAWIDNQFTAAMNQFEQNLIDQQAQIEADRENMTNLINTKTQEFDESLAANMDEAYRLAEKNYGIIRDEITDKVDTTRVDLETKITDAVALWEAQAILDYNALDERITSDIDNARLDMELYTTQAAKNTLEQAEVKATELTNAVKTELETVTSGHRQIIDNLESTVMNIDDFIGSRDRTLQTILDEQRAEIEQKIEVYNKNFPNLVVGSTLENIDGFEPYQTTELELRTEESLNYIRTYDVEGRNTLAYYFPDTVYLEQGNTYTIGVDFRSDSVEDLDYIYFMGPYNNVALTPLAQTRGLIADGTWHRYYFTFDWVDTTRHARLMIGTLLTQGSTQRGWFDTRQVHVYKGGTHNIPWTPSPSDNAQVVSQLLYEMRQLEDGMSTLATKTEVDLLTGNVTQLTNEYQSTSEQVSSKLQNFDDALGVNGSHFTQIAEQVQSKVWLNDVTDINSNLIPFADVSNISDMYEYWSRFGTNSTGSHAIALDADGFYVFRDTVAESNLALESSTFEEIKEGEQYTLSFMAKTHSNINDNYNYTFIINPSGSNHPLGMWTNRKHIRDNIYLYEWTFEARWTGEARVLIGSTTTPGTDARIRFKEPKLERGSNRTPFLNAFSNIEQLANKISLQVQELDGEYLTQSDIEIQPGYVQLGSQRLGDSQLASIFRVSPNSIEAITERMTLNGDLYVDGDITALAVSAINAEFSDLFAARVRAGSVHADYVEGFAGRFSSLYTLNANIERLVSQSVFTDAVTTKSLEAVNANIGSLRTSILTSNVIKSGHVDSKVISSEHIVVDNALVNLITARSVFADVITTNTLDAINANIGSIRTAILTADVINSDHIQVGTALVDKIFATSARIDELITKSHFVNEMHALTLNVVDLNASQIRTKLLSANTIEADWIKSGTALLDKVFSSTAMFERMMAKSGFVTTLNTVTIDTDQLTIRRPDGVAWVSQGLARGHVPVQIFDNYADSSVQFSGLNFVTSSSFWKNFKYFYTPHEGSRLRVVWAVSLQTGNSTSEYIEVGVNGFGNYNPINNGTGSSTRRQLVYAGQTEYITQDIPLPPPNFQTFQANLQFRRSPTGVHLDNRVTARILHIGQYD